MSNKLFHLILFGILALTCMSCDEDSFSQVVEIDVPAHESALAVTAHIVEDQICQILVSSSRGILIDDEFDFLPEARVRLLDGDQMLGLAEYDAITGYFLIDSKGWTIDENTNFRIEVDAGDFKSVSAETTVPSKVEVKDITFKKDGGLSIDGYAQDLVTIEFDDPPNELNYYALSASITAAERFFVDPLGDTIRFISGGNIYLDSNDPLVNYSEEYGLIFNDAAIDGKNTRLEVLADVWDETADTLTVKLHSISRDAFLYDRSLSAFVDNDGNPFAEPVTVHSNVEDGYGILDFSRSDGRKLRIN